MTTTTLPVPPAAATDFAALQSHLDATRPPEPANGLGVAFLGLYAIIDRGEVVYAIVDCAESFADVFGEPVTHARALEVARALNDATAFHGTGLLGGWSAAVYEAIEEARAEARADRGGE